MLAAGYATRLYPLTQDNPKPLLGVGGKPIVEHLIRKIEEIDGVDEIFIVTNAKFYDVFENWLSGFNSTKKIKILNDNTTSNEDRLGSLGDVNFAIEKENIKDDILLVAGDNLFEFSLKEFLDGLKPTGKSAVVLYDVADRELVKQYGIVEVDKNNKMLDFEEKPSEPKSTLASTGIYFYPSYVLPMLQNYVHKYKNSDKAGNFLEWLHKNEDVYCYITQKRWIDIGSLDQLEKARKEFNG
ncbi:MAG: nucleotidyltransferase family protein [Nanoarchaeota archaeon]